MDPHYAQGARKKMFPSRPQIVPSTAPRKQVLGYYFQPRSTDYRHKRAPRPSRPAFSEPRYHPAMNRMAQTLQAPRSRVKPRSPRNQKARRRGSHQKNLDRRLQLFSRYRRRFLTLGPGRTATTVNWRRFYPTWPLTSRRAMPQHPTWRSSVAMQRLARPRPAVPGADSPSTSRSSTTFPGANG